MSPQEPPDAALVLGLELVVELLADPLAHLRGERLRVQARGEPLHEGQQHHRVAQIRVDRLRHPGVLDLHGHVVAVDRRGAMDLTDRGRCERMLVEVAEHALERTAELPAHQLLELREPNGRDVVAERREPPLQLVPLVLGKAVELDHRDHLTDLHRRATHLPELIDELLDELRGALFLGRRRPLRRPDPVGGSHPGPAQTLPRHEPADTRRPGESALGQLSRLPARIFVLPAH